MLYGLMTSASGHPEADVLQIVRHDDPLGRSRRGGNQVMSTEALLFGLAGSGTALADLGRAAQSGEEAQRLAAAAGTFVAVRAINL